MGIQHLNRYLRDHVSNKAIHPLSLQELSGKRIAVDISIYMYKFSSLVENFYSMISLFNFYQIEPVFVFDGKPPPEKAALLQRRREARKEAWTILQKNQETMNEKTKRDLERQCKQIKKEDILLVKSLIEAMGYSYVDAPSEADALCSHMARRGDVWGCLSEDMDLFVYGCPHVLRYFSLLNHSLIHYDTSIIFKELKTTEEDFRAICVLSGCDFQEETWPLTECFQRFYQCDPEFDKQRHEIQPTIDMFSDTHVKSNIIEKTKKKINISVLRQILQQEGFLIYL